MTRRTLLAAGAGAAVSAAAAQPAAAARVVRRVRRPSAWRRGSYAERVGERWRIRKPAAGMLALVAVEDLEGTTPRGHALAGRQDAFMLVFEQRSGAALEEGVATISHPELGPVRLFLMPGRPRRRPRHIAIVNRAR